MSDQLNVAEAEERARKWLSEQSGKPHTYSIPNDVLALAARYREAVEALEQIRREASDLFDRERSGMTLGLIADRCDAVLAKARAALQEDPAPDNEKALLDGGGSLTEAARAIKVLLAFRDIHEDEKIGLRKAAWLLGIALGREKEQPKP